MKNVIIVLVLAALLGAAGFVITAETMRRRQNAANPTPELTGDRDIDMKNTLRMNAQASADLSKRQDAAIVGAGVGAGVGALLGILIVVRMGRRKASARAPAHPGSA